jgi:hypothetical protein
MVVGILRLLSRTELRTVNPAGLRGFHAAARWKVLSLPQLLKRVGSYLTV